MYKNGQLITFQATPWYSTMIVARVMKRDRMTKPMIYMIPTKIKVKLPKGSWLQFERKIPEDAAGKDCVK